jgi:hypothetical protein
MSSSVRYFHELHRDPQPIPHLAYAAFQHGGDVEHPTYFGHRRVLALECERRGTRSHPQTADLGEHVEQFVRQPIREVLIRFVTTAVHER